jgi:hypothetical protein
MSGAAHAVPGRLGSGTPGFGEDGDLFPDVSLASPNLCGAYLPWEFGMPAENQEPEQHQPATDPSSIGTVPTFST